jgi:hypothetical protein
MACYDAEDNHDEAEQAGRIAEGQSVVARRGYSLVAWALADTASRRPVPTQIVTTHVTAAADRASSGTVCHGATRAATMPTTALTPQGCDRPRHSRAGNGCLKYAAPTDRCLVMLAWYPQSWIL